MILCHSDFLYSLAIHQPSGSLVLPRGPRSLAHTQAAGGVEFPISCQEAPRAPALPPRQLCTASFLLAWGGGVLAHTRALRSRAPNKPPPLTDSYLLRFGSSFESWQSQEVDWGSVGKLHPRAPQVSCPSSAPQPAFRVMGQLCVSGGGP